MMESDKQFGNHHNNYYRQESMGAKFDEKQDIYITSIYLSTKYLLAN